MGIGLRRSCWVLVLPSAWGRLDMGEWTDTTLGCVTDFLSGGTPLKAQPEYWGGSIPWVSAKDMKRFRLDDTEDHVTERGVANGTKLVPAGTVLLLARGMGAGAYYSMKQVGIRPVITSIATIDAAALEAAAGTIVDHKEKLH